jgi:hypothetical protein
MYQRTRVRPLDSYLDDMSLVRELIRQRAQNQVWHSFAM